MLLLPLLHRFSLQLKRIKFGDVSLRNVQNDGSIYGNRIFVLSVASFNCTHTQTRSLLALMAIN